MENGLLYVLAFSAMAIALFACVLPQATWAGLEDAPVVSWSKTSVYKGDTTTIVAGVATQIIFPSENYDVLNEYNTGTGNFTATRTGYYSVKTGSAFMPISNNLGWQLKIYVGNTEVTRSFQGGYSTVSLYNGIYVSRDLYVTNGTTIGVYAFGGSNGTLYGGRHSTFMDVSWIGE